VKKAVVFGKYRVILKKKRFLSKKKPLKEIPSKAYNARIKD